LYQSTGRKGKTTYTSKNEKRQLLKKRKVFVLLSGKRGEGRARSHIYRHNGKR